MKILKNLKHTLKKNAEYIRELKSQRKVVEHGYVPDLERAQHEFRIGHIAYCLLRGRTPEQIESRHKEDYDSQYWRKRAWEEAYKLKTHLEKEMVDETICPSA